MLFFKLYIIHCKKQIFYIFSKLLNIKNKNKYYK